MMTKDGTQFCVECRKQTHYQLVKKKYKHCIRGKEYEFDVMAAVCEECGEEVNLPGLLDYNAQVIDRQYREMEGLVTIADIQTLMDVYNIGKAPLSLALGFGEITITRYLQGQYPSTEYSAVIRKALESPDYMLECLNVNRDKIGETAYKKSWDAAMDMKKLIGAVSEKMLITISYIFEKSKEVTPLALQKILYYIQGIYLAVYARPLFGEECKAWAHGPVYEAVYNMFKGFKYSPIEDKRFTIVKNRFHNLTDEERAVIDPVLNSFGMYSGKALEFITHKEAPWRDAYNDECTYGYANETITNQAIADYFRGISRMYNIKTEEGLKQYIQSQLAI